MWGKIIIPMYGLWLNGLYGLYGPRCPLSSKRPINLISLSLSWKNVCVNNLVKMLSLGVRCKKYYIKSWGKLASFKYCMNILWILTPLLPPTQFEILANIASGRATEFPRSMNDTRTFDSLTIKHDIKIYLHDSENATSNETLYQWVSAS